MIDHWPAACYCQPRASPLCRPSRDHHGTGAGAVPVHSRRRKDRGRGGGPGLAGADPARSAARFRVPDERMAAPGDPRDPLAARAEKGLSARRRRRLARRITLVAQSLMPVFQLSVLVARSNGPCGRPAVPGSDSPSTSSRKQRPSDRAGDGVECALSASDRRTTRRVARICDPEWLRSA